ncbi:unnamed protein product, partial [Discosporangium mesarthrocarpum]
NVCIVGNSSPSLQHRAGRMARVLAEAFQALPENGSSPSQPDVAKSRPAPSLGRHVGALVHTLISLVQDNQVKEAETMCRILSGLGPLLQLDPSAQKGHASMLKEVCKEAYVSSPQLARRIASLYLQANLAITTRDGKVDCLLDMGKQVAACLGPLESDDSQDEDDRDRSADLTFQIINPHTINAIVEVTLGALESCMEEVEYALRLMQKVAVAAQARAATELPRVLLGCRPRQCGGGGQGEGGSQVSSVATVSDDDDSNHRGSTGAGGEGKGAGEGSGAGAGHHPRANPTEEEDASFPLEDDFRSSDFDVDDDGEGSGHESGE